MQDNHLIYKIAVVGGESTGKSTLSARLAAELGCLWVPEFARLYLDATGPAYTEQAVLMMAHGQIALEDAMVMQGSNTPILICDTNLVVFYVWLWHSYHRIPAWIDESLRSRKYDLTLLCAPTIPWQDDPLREHPDLQTYFFAEYKRVLNLYQIPFVVVDASSYGNTDLAAELARAGITLAD